MGSYHQFYEVVRPISAEDGSAIPAGTVVDATGWKNLHRLVSNGRLKPTDKSATSPVEESAPKPRKRAKAADDAIVEEPVTVEE
jgi:hypothetical protein